MAVSLRSFGNVLSQRLRLFSYTTQYYSRISNELIKNTSPASQDILLNSLKNCRSSRELLQQVGDHSQIMNNKHVIQAFRTLFAFHKHERGEVSSKDILSHPNFEKLCQQIKKNAGAMEVNDTIEVLKVLTYIGVNSSSTIMQVLLQLARHNINTFTLPQIIFLDFLLHHMQSTPLVDALKIALPIVFETHLPVKMSRDDMSHIAEYMQYVSKREVSENCVESVIAAALKCTDPMTADRARSIIWSICDMQPDTFFEPLLNKAIHAMLVDMEHMRYDDIETTVVKLLSKFSMKYKFYYNEPFLDMCADMIVYKDLGFERAVYMLKRYSNIGHVNTNLIDYVCAYCAENPKLVLEGNSLHIYALICALALSEHRPKEWHTVQNLLKETKCFEASTNREILWIKMTASLASMGIYKEDVIARAFDMNILQKVFRKFFISDYENIFLVRQAIQLYQPNLSHLLPPDQVIIEFNERVKEPYEAPLHDPIAKGIGGEHFVLTNLKTNDGFIIDHCVVMKNGFPVGIEKYIDEIKNNELPADCQVVAVLALKMYHHPLNNPTMMKGTTKLLIQVLEDKGFCVVPICISSWNELEDYEKIPFIMQAITEKTGIKLQVSHHP